MSFNKKPKTINPDEVDPSVYYYDEVYDEMKEDEGAKKGTGGSSSKPGEKTSKYIQGLKESADLRKTEQELRKFKKFARDREETEGDLDQEDIYITPAYQRKLADIKELEEKRIKQLKANDYALTGVLKPKEPSGSLSRGDNKPQDQPSTSKSSDQIESEPKIPPHEPNVTPSDEVQEPKTIRKPLKTFDERRAFLKEVLAKRTVGEVFDQAVLRYKARKAFKQQ